MDTIKSSIVAAPAAAQKNPSETAKVSREKARKAEAARAAARREEASRESRDRFTASEAATGDAVYDVRDIRRGRSSLALGEADPPQSRLHGEIVIQKMVEIPLATGRKRLSVYKKDE
jgi:hypothetical protein